MPISSHGITLTKHHHQLITYSPQPILIRAGRLPLHDCTTKSSSSIQHLLRGNLSSSDADQNLLGLVFPLDTPNLHSHKSILHIVIILGITSHWRGKACRLEHGDPHVSWECHPVRRQVTSLYPTRA
ncbi:hypothetical protein WISP_132733 [Willisornis vidua]|uniref:Uncharacterized protein n=1 Tax=Willisornis vidua TaxID=1566151 RepID=A0ABQ9CP84_9PASS|nr:hypothetical protein WISP_132733 [Willisornis vidua]